MKWQKERNQKKRLVTLQKERKLPLFVVAQDIDWF